MGQYVANNNISGPVSTADIAAEKKSAMHYGGGGLFL